MAINSVNNPPIDDFPGDGGSPPVVIITPELSVGNVGSTYLQYLDAAAGYPPYTWTITLGSLPPGLVLNNSGIISGTPTVAGSYTFTMKVTDQIGGNDVQAFYLQIDDVINPTITTTTLPSVLVGTVYNETIEANGGTPPYTFSLIVGSLPAGITLSSGGILSGTPTIPGNYSFTIQVDDDNALIDIQAFTIVVQAINPTITTTGLSGAITGIFYSSTINAVGGTTPYVNWDILSGSLPPGLTLISNPTNAVISGTPTSTGNFPFTIRVTDSLSGIDTQALSINIYDGTNPIISTISLSDGQIASGYSENLIAVGGSLPYVWSIIDGNLPVGLNLNTTTGLISGTPTANGSFIFTAKVKDDNDNVDTQILSIIIGNYTLPSIITDSLPYTIVGTNYSSYVQAVGGTMPYVWSLLSPLPTGLMLDSATGLISGIATNISTVNFDVVVTDSDSQIDIKSFTIGVGDPTLPIITTTSISIGDRTILYNQSLNASGGVPSYTWQLISGVLPAGLTLSTNGVISGIPTQIGVYPITIRVTDSASNIDTQDYVLIIKSSGYNSRCCICVFTGDIIEFSHNSVNGTLKATGGSILSNTQWQAPSIEGFYEVSISAEGVNGIITVTNIVNVIKKLELIENIQSINHLLPGDSFHIRTNYPENMVMWETLDYDFPVVTPNGHVFINTNSADKCFGAMECTVRGTLFGLENCNIDSYIDIKIKVNPVYPTPDVCGPFINKWMREVKDFRVITTEFEGGCDETHIRNKVPIVKWSVNYEGLSNYIPSTSICPSCGNCNNTSNSCQNQRNNNFDIGECNPLLRYSNRLDDFWNLVYGQYKSFTLIDHDTSEIWYNVKFNDITIDHRHRRTSTTRNVKLIWRPCCSKVPSGGTCGTHGMTNYKPLHINNNTNRCTLYTDITVTLDSVGYDDIIINWTASDYSLLSGYQVKINGDIYDNFVIDAGNNLQFNHNYLKSGTTYSYQVRAYDGNGKFSQWSNIIIIKTLSNSITFNTETLTFNTEEIIYY